MIVGNIDTKDISVVVQGGIDQKYTSDCLKSIRKHLPDSEIILSTWEGSDADGLDYDIIIFNKKIEKNFIDNEVLNLVNNTNRQIISTQNGIKKASKKYILKLRTDSLLLNNNFLQYFDKFQNRNKKYIGFKNRVIVPSVYAREYSNDIKLCLTFHPSDFYFFGLEEDIKDYLLDVELLKDVKNQGKKDSVIDVSDGYANNYLIKNNLAVPYTKKSKEILDKEIDVRVKTEEKLVEQFNEIKNKLNDKIIEFKVKTGAQDKVFGTVSSKQISDRLKEMGYNIDKKCIKINGSISTLGITNVEIELHKKVKFNIKINLVK